MKLENKKNIIILYNIVTILLVLVACYFYNNNMITYLMVIITVLIVEVVLFVYYLFINRSEDSIYESKLNSLLKTYESILVKSITLPTLDNKHILMTDNIEDIIDAQAEIRKPVYYYREIGCCSFILKDIEDVIIYILKVNDGVESILENEVIRVMELEKENKETIDQDLLESLEKTTMFVINNKVLKVSPVSKTANNEKSEEKIKYNKKTNYNKNNNQKYNNKKNDKKKNNYINKNGRKVTNNEKKK